MSAIDVLDVLNVQRDDTVQPVKKKAKTETLQIPKSGISRELYNLIGANTPPILVNMGSNRMKDRKLRVSPWTKMPFVPNQKGGRSPRLHHWEKGAKELLAETSKDKPYYFDKFVVSVDIPEMVDEELFNQFMDEITEVQRQRDGKPVVAGSLASAPGSALGSVSSQVVYLEKKTQLKVSQLSSTKLGSSAAESVGPSVNSAESNGSSESDRNKSSDSDLKRPSDSDTQKPSPKKPSVSLATEEESEQSEKSDETSKEKVKSGNSVEVIDGSSEKSGKEIGGNEEIEQETEAETNGPLPWTYEETKLLFQFCKDFELKWFVINDRFPRKYGRTLEDLKEQFYCMCQKIMSHNSIGNPSLIDALKGFSKPDELERKEYLLNLLKRTPTEIAEESLLVIEARRFEIAAKKMLQERANLLTLLDLPQADPVAQQFQSSQGLGNLYNQLMILNKDPRKKSQHKLFQSNVDPVPPPIPMAASSSHKRDFQTHLQQYLSGYLKLQPVRIEDNPIQQLLAKKLTPKEEEAYGLHYHANERLNPGVILRSTQRLSGLQQRQSVFKAVNNMLQELDIPTAGGTTWKPNMPTRKTMAKYDELTKAVVALLEVKKGKDKLEAEIELIKSQRGLS